MCAFERSEKGMEFFMKQSNEDLAENKVLILYCVPGPLLTFKFVAVTSPVEKFNL